jgi:heme exporter protein C
VRRLLPWLLWLWIAGVIVAAFLAPLAQGFEGFDGRSPQSSRIVFFHVPLAVASFVVFLAAGVASALYLARRAPRFDRAAHAAVEVGLVFAFLATVTGALWAKVQWGAYWNWDPRQWSIALALAFYGAYLVLRDSLEDAEQQARIGAAYAVLGLAVAPFLYFLLPRTATFSLHPKPAGAEMDAEIGRVVVAGILGFTALAFWLQSLRARILGFGAAEGSGT